MIFMEKGKKKETGEVSFYHYIVVWEDMSFKI